MRFHYIYLFIFIPRCFENPVLEFSPSDVSSGSPFYKEVFFLQFPKPASFYLKLCVVFFSGMGAVYGITKSSVGVASMGHAGAGLILCLVSCTFLAVRLLQFSPFPFINSFIEYVCTIVNNTK